jgi:REP element-mobilizing transposase RayT
LKPVNWRRRHGADGAGGGAGPAASHYPPLQSPSRFFFGPEGYRLYRRLIATAASRADTQIWAYCLMPNHVHLIAAPADEDGLRATFAEAHRRYTGAINARFDWTGHLFRAAWARW